MNPAHLATLGTIIPAATVAAALTSPNPSTLAAVLALSALAMVAALR